VALLSRWVRPPAALRKMFAPHERTLAVGDTADATVVASNLGLWLPDGSSWRRVGWQDVVKATWTGDSLKLIEGTVDDGLITDLPIQTVALSDPRNLPTVVRIRVEASIARWEQVHVPGGSARLVARRVPGVDGLTWTARLDTGTPDSEAARAVLRSYLEQVAT
jgi:hypothetical protein